MNKTSYLPSPSPVAAAIHVLVVAATLFSPLAAQTLTWDANAPLDSVTSYRIYYGHAPADRQFFFNVGLDTTFTFAPKFTQNTYFVVTALNVNGESGYSNEVSFIVSPTNICDCDGDGAPKYMLDYAKLRRLIGQNKFKADGSINPKYQSGYDINQDSKIDGLDAALHKRQCR